MTTPDPTVQYAIKVLTRKLSELAEDHSPSTLAAQQRRSLCVAIKILTDGVGYLGPCVHSQGHKIIHYNEVTL